MRERRRGREKLIWLFYLVFAIGLIFIAGEETSWGQYFFHFHTPGFFERHNEQDDLTLHNLDGMNGRTIISGSLSASAASLACSRGRARVFAMSHRRARFRFGFG
jgi:hypothetical protein